jgi:hypothetical protein
MSCILYYSKYCEVSKKYLKIISNSSSQKDMHFICIDKRVKEATGKTYIILENGQKIILPENITRVPALLLLTKGYSVLYGEQILEYLKPNQEVEVRKATQNNMEPMAYSLGGGDIVSDQYSFLDQSPEDLEAKGNGGTRQMHNYVDLNTAFSAELPTHHDTTTTIRGVSKIGEDASNQLMENKLKQMQEERDSDLRQIVGNKPPLSY